MTDQKLKDCPFCGHKNIKIKTFSYRDVPGHKSYYCECAACDARLREKTNEDAAIKYWNTRADQPHPPVIEVLNAALDHWETVLKDTPGVKECERTKAVYNAAKLYAQGQTSQPVDLPRYGIEWAGPEQPIAVEMPDGYWTPYHLASRGMIVTAQQPTEDTQRALDAVDFCLSVIHNPRIPKKDNAVWSCGTSSKPRITEDILETIRAALNQQDFEVVDVDSVEPIIDRSAARHLSEKGYQIVRKK